MPTSPTRWNELTDVPEGFGPSVVTIGNFDGVHRGHLGVLALVVERARELDLRPVAITFEPHPVAVLYPERAPEPLTSTGHKLELLGGAGLEAVLVMEFTHALALWSPRRFVEEVVVRTLGAKLMVVGGDMRFGHRNSGNVDTLRELGAEFGFDVEVMPDLHDDDGDEKGDGERRWSSTWVRELVADGDVEGAAALLGRPHRVEGEVVHGDHRGRELGFPTANLGPDAVGAVPADGVYAGWLVRAAGERLPAAISVGTNPTFDGVRHRRVEAYVLDRTDLDLYGEQVAVDFVARLRATERFDSVEALVEQMAADVVRARELLAP
ncbi:bifunctional riboflavin kinase/FAD synthetase [Spongisporangium articulatum]|uniref:Riboflavin biosynthesis protein n=1 Tax=Spongisporangium articulatum TaxID=3362603 RepID=A0ABW8AMQ4_9ACTN